MIAGLPGTGIGGIFYLISALIMPLRELGKIFQGKSNVKRWRFVSRQLMLTISVLAGFWVTGLLLGLMLKRAAPQEISPGVGANAFHIKPVLISLTVLFTILIGVELINILIKARKQFIKLLN